ncbi:MAG: RAMP superfamily protein [Syntrophus sp. PtaU1.Bin208]|nr:MAG: RAMP superfamily protein [Syntrophus sp. PtaU1.Bin208]
MSENTLKLEKKIFITGEIYVKTGIHIGGSSLGLSIGGADKVVVRNPLDNLPYIPGSSLKGKMRSLLEKSYGLIEIKYQEDNDRKTRWTGPLCQNPDEPIVKLFGFPAEASGVLNPSHAPTRLTVRDCLLKNENELAAAENTDMYCTEVKTEVSIDRLTSAANPRNFERVPAGARFTLELILDVYNVDHDAKSEIDPAQHYLNLVREGLFLIEDDYLGGQGTRGYGQIKFIIENIEEKSAEDYRKGLRERTPSLYSDLFSCFTLKDLQPTEA